MAAAPRNAEARHRGQELPQRVGIFIKLAENIDTVFGFVLRLAGVQSLGKRIPETEQARVQHFQETADVGWLGAVQKQIRFGSVGIKSIGALQQFQRDQRIQEVELRARMDVEALANGGSVQRTFRQFREESDFHRAEQRFGGHEAEAKLHDGFRCGLRVPVTDCGCMCFDCGTSPLFDLDRGISVHFHFVGFDARERGLRQSLTQVCPCPEDRGRGAEDAAHGADHARVHAV